jgi:hypothetical protein
MLDRMLNRGLTLAVVVMETLAGGGALVLLLTAWKNLLAGQFAACGVNLVAALTAGIAAWWLVCHHEDLKG